MRIVALADQHGHLPAIQPCDLLLIGGDICPDVFGGRLARNRPELQAAWFDRSIRPWLKALPATYKVATWGNHDWCGMRCPPPEDLPDVASATRLQILVDAETCVPAGATTGDRADRATVRIWGTPWSNPFMDWAFMKSPAELANIYASIPEGIDVLLSHQPPYGYGDHVYDPIRERFEHLGSWELLAAIDRVRPRVVICGHIHSGHGRYEYKGIPICNVSVVDDQYRPVHEPTVIELP